MVDVRGLYHSFENRPVLENIDLHVKQGEILAVMGSSGGGKTTLLKCIAGLIQPKAGEIIVDGISVNRESEKARTRLGMVFQYAALFDYLSVEENVLFGARRQKTSLSSDINQLLQESLSAVGLTGSEKLLPAQLSGGMRKRVGLARALAMKPSVLLYDEPTSGLDPVTAYAIDQLIVETRARLGVTSIVVSHDVTSVFRVADQIAFLSKGKLSFFGDPSEFRQAPDQAIQELIQKSQSESLSL